MHWLKQIVTWQKIITLCLLTLAVNVHAKDPIYTGFFNNKALSGYDPVAYFTEGEPVKGDKDFQYQYQGADWYFASQENLNMFKADPEKYAPQYGGYCAWAVAAKHDFAPGDPEYWRIVDGKLYLNYDKSVQQKWEQNIQGFIREADNAWPQLLEE